MQTLLQDIRFALRQLRKAPGFTIVAVLTLALGIGANTAIYSIIHGALRLPYPNASRMMAIQNAYPQGSYYAVSYPDFQQWRAQSRDFTQIVAMNQNNSTLTGEGEPQTLNVGLVSEGYLDLFHLQPVLGRGFLSAEHREGAAPACVLVESFWRKQFHGDPSVLNRPINLGGKACTVVGVVPILTPSRYRAIQVWTPLEPKPPQIRHGWNYLLAVGLLRPGVTQAAGLAELRGIQAQIDKQFPDNKHGIDIHPLAQFFFGDLRPVMLVLQAAVGFILLIACVNLANMLLARAADRGREFAVRRALGASQRRMLQQVLTESLLLTVTGAVGGILFAEALLHIPISAWPEGYTPPSGVPLDGEVLAFAALLALVTGVFFGIFPALRLRSQESRDALQQSRTMSESREQKHTRSLLVIAEMALSMLLVAAALNMAIYFSRLLRVDPGVNADHTLTVTLLLPELRYPKPDDQRKFFDRVQDLLAVLPGVKAVGGSVDLPFAGPSSTGDFDYEGSAKGTDTHLPFAEQHFVTPGYFAAVQTPILQGRGFTIHDQPDAQKVMVINRGMAQRLWPGQNALGKHIQFANGWHEVVGIAQDVRFGGAGAPVGLQIYVSSEQHPLPYLNFILRTEGDPLALAESARHAVQSIDPGQAILEVSSLQALADASVAGQRTSTMVTAILGCLALLLASIGVYGVMAYSVSRREREFGIRMAVGADRGSILRMLFSGVLRLVAAGVLIGAGLVYAARAWIDSMLGGNGTNPAALGVAAALLCAVALLATFMPARRATRVQPMQALRAE